MKLILLFIISVFLIAYEASAQVSKSEFNQLKSRVTRTERDIRDLQNNSGQTYTVDSKVELTCMDDQKDNHPGFPDTDIVLGWLDACRTAPVDPARCSITQALGDQPCMAKVDDFLPGRPSNEDFQKLTKACKKLKAICRI